MGFTWSRQEVLCTASRSDRPHVFHWPTFRPLQYVPMGRFFVATTAQLRRTYCKKQQFARQTTARDSTWRPFKIRGPASARWYIGHPKAVHRRARPVVDTWALMGLPAYDFGGSVYTIPIIHRLPCYDFWASVFILMVLGPFSLPGAQKTKET